MVAWDQVPQWAKKAQIGDKKEKCRPAKQAQWWPGDGEKGRHPFPSLNTYWLASLFDFFPFFSPNEEPSLRLGGWALNILWQKAAFFSACHVNRLYISIIIHSKVKRPKRSQKVM